jgi:hypothetical protein
MSDGECVSVFRCGISGGQLDCVRRSGREAKLCRECVPAGWGGPESWGDCRPARWAWQGSHQGTGLTLRGRCLGVGFFLHVGPGVLGFGGRINVGLDWRASCGFFWPHLACGPGGRALAEQARWRGVGLRRCPWRPADSTAAQPLAPRLASRRTHTLRPGHGFVGLARDGTRSGRRTASSAVCFASNQGPIPTTGPGREGEGAFASRAPVLCCAALPDPRRCLNGWLAACLPPTRMGLPSIAGQEGCSFVWVITEFCDWAFLVKRGHAKGGQFPPRHNAAPLRRAPSSGGRVKALSGQL